MYRQVAAGDPAQSQLALQARQRLDAALQRRRAGEVAATPASIAPRTDQADLQRLPLGAVENGRYRHRWSGIEFSVPPGWDVGETGPSSDHGEQVALIHEESDVIMSVWMIREATPAAMIPQRLESAPGEKVRQRRNGYVIPGFEAKTYDIPPHSVQRLWIGGRQAVLAIGEYMTARNAAVPSVVTVVSATGERRRVPIARIESEPELMNEYMTWIYSENSRAFFFARVRPADLVNVRPLLDQIISSATVP
jgi:hypothetical protein